MHLITVNYILIAPHTPQPWCSLYENFLFVFLFCDFNLGAAIFLPCKLCQISCMSSSTTLLSSVALFPLCRYWREAEVHLGRPGACFLLTWSLSSAQVLVQSAYFSEKDAGKPEDKRWGCHIGTEVFQQTRAALTAAAGMLWLQRARTWWVPASGPWQKRQAPALSTQAPAVPPAALSAPIRRLHVTGLSPCLLFYCLNQLNCYPDRVSCWCKWTVLCQGICPYSWLPWLSTMHWLCSCEAESEVLLADFIRQGGHFYLLPFFLYPENRNGAWIKFGLQRSFLMPDLLYVNISVRSSCSGTFLICRRRWCVQVYLWGSFCCCPQPVLHVWLNLPAHPLLHLIAAAVTPLAVACLWEPRTCCFTAVSLQHQMCREMGLLERERLKSWPVAQAASSLQKTNV